MNTKNPKNKPKLKPCPFCGNKKIDIYEWGITIDKTINCKCGITLEGNSGKFVTVNSIVKAWNTRK